jgi:hypothetical protein
VTLPLFFLNGGDDFKTIREWYAPRNMVTGKKKL